MRFSLAVCLCVVGGAGFGGCGLVVYTLQLIAFAIRLCGCLSLFLCMLVGIGGRNCSYIWLLS